MSVYNLVFDRTYDDVEEALALREKAVSGGFSSLSASEQAKYMAGLKGAFNASVANRVGEAVEEVADKINNLDANLTLYRNSLDVADSPNLNPGYGTVTVNPKKNWVYNDTMSKAQEAQYCGDVATIRGVSKNDNLPEAPANLDNLDYVKLNNIEEILYAVDAELTGVEAVYQRRIDMTHAAFEYAGITESGG